MGITSQTNFSDGLPDQTGQTFIETVKRAREQAQRSFDDASARVKALTEHLALAQTERDRAIFDLALLNKAAWSYQADPRPIDTAVEPLAVVADQSSVIAP